MLGELSHKKSFGQLPEGHLQPVFLLLPFQAKAAVEKSKQVLESNTAELTSEIQQLNSSRQEADRKKKLAEGTLQELTIKSAEQDRIASELSEKLVKLQANFFYIF